MEEHFVLEGKEVEDNILFYWSIASISRALRLNAEAQHQDSASHVLATVAGYYSLFHLGIFLLLSAPRLKKAKELREFVNYGPDMLTGQKGFRVFNRKHHPQEADDVLGRIDTAFVEAVEWVSQVESDSKPGVPIALSKAADFFLPNENGAPYYSEWSSPEVLSEADDLRRLLHHRSQGLVYPKS
jgi:hypothetical protein